MSNDVGRIWWPPTTAPSGPCRLLQLSPGRAASAEVSVRHGQEFPAYRSSAPAVASVRELRNDGVTAKVRPQLHWFGLTQRGCKVRMVNPRHANDQSSVGSSWTTKRLFVLKPRHCVLQHRPGMGRVWSQGSHCFQQRRAVLGTSQDGSPDSGLPTASNI